MSDRLTSLKEQRALIAEHLRWLDREIAASEAATPSRDVESAGNTRRSFASTAVESVKIERIPAAPGFEDPLVVQLQEEERRKTQISKSGCWMVFSILMIGLIAVFGAWMLLRYS